MQNAPAGNQYPYNVPPAAQPKAVATVRPQPQPSTPMTTLLGSLDIASDRPLEKHFQVTRQKWDLGEYIDLI